MGTPTFLNISSQVTPQPVNTDTTKQVLLIGQRVTNGIFRQAAAGFVQPDYYAPIALPSFKDGNSALQYLSQLGFRVQIGQTIQAKLSSPITLVTANAGITSITYSGKPYGFEVLTSGVVSGTVTQTIGTAVSLSSSKAKLSADAPNAITNVITATIVSAYIDIVTGNAVLNVNNVQVTGTGAATTFIIGTNYLSVNGINNNGLPDATATDPIALLAYDFYQTALSANTSVVGAPIAILSVTNGDAGRDGFDIRPPSPTNGPIGFVAPIAVAGDAFVATLTYPITTAKLSWLPLTAVGNINVTQYSTDATPSVQAVGTLISTQVADGNIILTVSVTKGAFSVATATPAGGTVIVLLDNTIDVFSYLENIQLHSAVSQFPIRTLADFGSQGNFYNGVASLNTPSEALNGHYGTYAIAGNVTSLPNQAGLLPIADDQYKILVTYPYVPSFGDVVYENTNANNIVASGRIASAVAYLLANGDAPFPALKLAVIKHLPVASSYVSTSYSRKQGGNGNIAINQGWLPLTINPSGVVYFLQSNTSLITIPNTSIPNVEFSYTHIWDCVKVIKQLVAELFNNSIQLPNNTGSANLSVSFVNNFRASVISGLYTLQSAEVVFNVGAYASLVTAATDPNDPSQLDVYVPSQIIPQFNGANILINVFSANYVFNQQQ